MENRRVVGVREAAFAPAEWVPLPAAEGRVSACCAGVYPPGIPAVTYGEEISGAAVRALLRAQAEGRELFGLRRGLLRVTARKQDEESGKDERK